MRFRRLLSGLVFGACALTGVVPASPALAETLDNGFKVVVKQKKSQVIATGVNSAGYLYGWYMTLEHKTSNGWVVVDDNGLSSEQTQKLRAPAAAGKWRACVEIDSGRSCSKKLKVKVPTEPEPEPDPEPEPEPEEPTRLTMDDPAAEVAHFIALVNDARVDAGLAPFAKGACLQPFADAAADKSARERDPQTSRSTDARDACDVLVGEYAHNCIYSGQDAFDYYMGEDWLPAGFMNPDATEMAVAVAKDEAGTPYWNIMYSMPLQGW